MGEDIKMGIYVLIFLLVGLFVVRKFDPDFNL